MKIIVVLLLACALALAGCAQVTPTPTPVPTATAPTVVAVVTRPAATKAPTKAPNTPKPTFTATENPPTAAPTKTATHVPPTRTPRPPTTAPTEVPPTPVPPTPAPTAPPAPVAPPASFQPTELIAIPEGLLKMGGPAEEDDPDEKPRHDVNMYAFQIEKYEVTNAQYQACVTAGACPAPIKNSSGTRPSYFGNPDFANYPVVNVTWFGADAYCKWTGRRLPNEAEWERAARGVENWRYTWSNSIGMHFEWNAIFHGSPISFCEASCPFQNYWTDVNDGFADTAPVGRFAEYDSSSGFGVVDMAGNVSEWTSNWYDGNAYTDGNDIYGPSESTGVKVFRGGSWADQPRRNSDRDSLAPDQATDRIGLRCAQ